MSKIEVRGFDVSSIRVWKRARRKASFAKHQARIENVEDRLKHVERLLMEKAR